MTYKKKLATLSIAAAALALIYILGAVFEPERRGTRAASFSWLDPKTAEFADTITVKNAEETLTLSLKEGQWYVSHNGKNYPAKQPRAEDFINVFTRHASWQVVSENDSSHERLGLDDASAARVTFSGGTGPALLDVLIGQGDATGRNVYARRYGENEVRSGENVFAAYLSTERPAWYNLRLIPETEDGTLGLDQVQRLSAYPSAASGAASQVFTRNGGQWTAAGMEAAELDMEKIDTYVRGILNAEGDDFNDAVLAGGPELNESRIVIELGSGEIKSMRFSAPDADKRRLASVSGSELVYALPEWMSSRLFYDDDHFKKSGETATTETATTETTTP